MIEDNENVNVDLDDERGPERSPTKKIKREPTSDSDELSEKITKQLDYYFSDVNIIKDKYLQEKLKENNGWVKLSDLLTFVKLKELTKSDKRVVQALKECKSLIIDVDEDKFQVKRKNPMPDPAEFQKQLDLRTVHISGFPTDYEFDQLRRFCIQFGEVESVAMRRRFKTKFFKGCIHVVFKNEADAKKVLETELLKCKDRELKKESMAEYHRRKAEMAQKRHQKIKERKNGVSVEKSVKDKKDKPDEANKVKEEEGANEGKGQEISQEE